MSIHAYRTFLAVVMMGHGAAATSDTAGWLLLPSLMLCVLAMTLYDRALLRGAEGDTPENHSPTPENQ